MAMVAINGMKGINSTYGLKYGDQVLRKMAAIINEQFPSDVYRFGGDEFVIVCTEFIQQEFQQKVVTMRQQLEKEQLCNFSMGISWGNAEEMHQLRTQVREMCAADKQSYYHNVLSGTAKPTEAGMAGEVIQDINEGRFIVYYQPQIDLETGFIAGAEALVRKKDEDGNIVPPGKFIPLYEVCGVISHVDLFVLRSACQTLGRWIKNNQPIRISANFSRVTLLEPNIVDVIGGICDEYGVPYSLITIEVTESISKMNANYLHKLIHELKQKGFNISLDDFGSQYSNLAILSAMDFDEIKFDRELVSSLETNEKSRLVIENCLQMCHVMEGTQSLAEGIETKGQLDVLTSCRCKYGQGFYFAKPLPVEEFEVFMQEHKE